MWYDQWNNLALVSTIHRPNLARYLASYHHGSELLFFMVIKRVFARLDWHHNPDGCSKSILTLHCQHMVVVGRMSNIGMGHLAQHLIESDGQYIHDILGMMGALIYFCVQKQKWNVMKIQLLTQLWNGFGIKLRIDNCLGSFSSTHHHSQEAMGSIVQACVLLSTPIIIELKIVLFLIEPGHPTEYPSQSSLKSTWLHVKLDTGTLSFTFSKTNWERKNTWVVPKTQQG